MEGLKIEENRIALIKLNSRGKNYQRIYNNGYKWVAIVFYLVGFAEILNWGNKYQVSKCCKKRVKENAKQESNTPYCFPAR